MIVMTGGTGLLGMRIAYDLLSRGKSLRMLRRHSSDMELFSRVLDFYNGSDSTTLRSNIEWIEGDILDPEFMKEAISDCSICIHSAAMVSFHPRDNEIMRRLNIDGTANIVNACLENHKTRLVYISSVAALGRTEESGSMDEKSLWKDSPYNSGYAISKYHAEMEIWRGIEEGLEAVIVNPTIILGAGANDRSSGTIFGVVAKGLPFYTDGGASVVDARDVSKVVIALMESEVNAERFVLNARSLPYKDLFGMIAKRMDKRPPYIHIGRTLLGIAWRLTAIKDLLLRSRSSVTRETALSARCSYSYDSRKVKEQLGLEFLSLEESIEYYTPFYSLSS